MMIARIAICLTLGVFPHLGLARQQFQVVDQNGQPVENAVIMANGVEPVPTHQPAVMDQIQKRFVPHVLTIVKGQTVEFPNSDNVRHHVYSFSKTKPFELKLYKGKPHAPVQFDRPGIVVLGCNIHDSMVGYIVVSDTAAWGQTDTNGRAIIDMDDAMTTIRVWHPRLSLNAYRVNVVTINPNEELHRIELKLVSKEPKSSGFSTDRFKRFAP